MPIGPKANKCKVVGGQESNLGKGGGGGRRRWGTQGQGTYILLKPELLGNVADLLQRRFWALQEHVLQVASHSVLNTRSLSLSGLHKGLCFAYLGGWRTDGKGRAGRASFRPDEQQYHGVGGSSKLLSAYQLDGIKKKNPGRVVWTRGFRPSPSRTEELHSIPLRATTPTECWDPQQVPVHPLHPHLL